MKANKADKLFDGFQVTEAIAAGRALRFTEAEASFQQRQSMLNDALTDSDYCPHEEDSYCGCYVMDVFDTYFIYRSQGETYRLDYTIDGDNKVTLEGEPTEVLAIMTYPDAPADDLMTAESGLTERNIPQSERDKMSKSDFAGKGNSFPISKPEDVAAAARSIGRAGSGNFSPDELKRRITKIAKRKGAAFEAKLPAAWTAKKESAPPKVHAKGSPFAQLTEADIETDPILLQETDLVEAGVARIKIIQPGWGSSGHYSESLLRKSAPRFKAGLKMFIDHPTAAEEAARPEGAVLNIAAELTEDARYETDGPDGPGFSAPAKVFDHFKSTLRELKDTIGVSIRGRGTAAPGTAEGRKGPIIHEIAHVASVDFVTAAGAGGRILDLMESRRKARESQPTKEQSMTPEEQKQLADLATENATLRARINESAILQEAKTYVASVLKTIEMPDLTRARLTESLVASPVTKDGKLDEAAYKAVIEARAKEEVEYLAKLTGSGAVKGMGAVSSTNVTEAKKLTESRAKFAENLSRLGGVKPESAVAAIGRR